MSQNITWLGASYSAVPAITLPKTGGGTATFTDVTDTTATASDVAQGLYFYTSAGVRTAGTASGGGGDSYTRTVVVPQQTFTPVANQNNAYQAELTYSSGLVSGEPYIITYDGEEYVCDCSDPLWGSDRMMGTIAAMWGDRGDGVFPFAVDYSSGNMYVASFDLNQHTIKIEHLEFVDGPLTIIPKSITQNGTYSASSDNADGYSSVTVNVASGGGGDSYTLTTVVSQQTVTVSSSSYTASITIDSPFVVGDYYLVTYDGTEYLCTGGSNWNDQNYIGDSTMLWYDGSGNSPSSFAYPFAFERIEYNSTRTLHAASGSHTVKVEHLEFVDGPLNLITKSITSNGTYAASSDNADGYSSVTVNVSSGGSPTLQSKTATPTTSQQVIQPDNGYDGLSQVTVNAIPSQYIVPSGNKAITANGTGIDVAEYATVSVNVSGSSKNVQVAQSTTRVASTSYTKTASLTCSVSGTYDVYWDCFRSTTSGTSGSQLYIGGSASGSANTTFSNHAQNNHRTGVTINANQEVAVYVRSRATNYYAYCGQLTIVQTA